MLNFLRDNVALVVVLAMVVGGFVLGLGLLLVVVLTGL
jgi:hypothetical protein